MAEKKSGFRQRLPTDIEAEMLLHLPVKTLKRFEFACKAWYYIIHSPDFQRTYLRRAQADALLLTLQKKVTNVFDGYDVDLDLRFAIYNSSGYLVKTFSKPVTKPYFSGGAKHNPMAQSCHGLVCISTNHRPMLVCNPTTEEIISLPPPNLALLSSDQCFGFGYIASTNEYKVVRFYCDLRRNCCEVLILGIGYWREAKTPPPFIVFQGTAPFLNGALHLLHGVEDGDLQVGPEAAGSAEVNFLAVFDLETEDYKKILLPEGYHSLVNWKDRSGFKNLLRLSKLGGELCLTFDLSGYKQRLEVWVLKDYFDGKWDKCHIIDISSFYNRTASVLQCFPLDSIDGETILLNCADLRGVKLISYNTEDGKVLLKRDNEWGASFFSRSFYHLTDGALPVEDLSDYKDYDSDDADKNVDPSDDNANADGKDEEEDEDDFLRPPTKKNGALPVEDLSDYKDYDSDDADKNVDPSDDDANAYEKDEEEDEDDFLRPPTKKNRR